LGSTLVAVDWLAFVGLVWLVLLALFWCLLVLAGRADRRDADASRRIPTGAAAGRPQTMGRFAQARGVLRPRAPAPGTDHAPEASEDLIQRRARRR
jgi:hypothetical protein